MGFCANPCSGEDLFGFLLVQRLSSDCKTVKHPYLQTENLKETIKIHHSNNVPVSFLPPCLRASVFLRLLGAPLRGCGLSALATSTSSRLVFKRRRHKKLSPYKNFANFA